MKVTFDTNILVSAFEFPNGRAARVLLNIRSERDLMFISHPIIEELLRVLAQKFGRTPTELEGVRAFIRQFGHLVTPTETLHILADEPDNRILECAVAADTDLIVTGDRQMLALQSFRDIRIMALADYLENVDNPSINRHQRT